jgi:hypothetical protein
MNGVTGQVTDAFSQMGTTRINVSVQNRGLTRVVNPDDIYEMYDKNSELLAGVSPNVTMMASVKSAMKAKGATDEAVMLYTFKGENIDTTKSVEELTESYLKTYDANYRTLRGDGASPRNGDGNPNPKEDKFLNDYFARKASEGKFPENK